LLLQEVCVFHKVWNDTGPAYLWSGVRLASIEIHCAVMTNVRFQELNSVGVNNEFFANPLPSAEIEK